MKLSAAEKAAYKVLMTDRKKILYRLAKVADEHPVDAELPVEIGCLKRLLKPASSRNRYFTMFNNMTLLIQCLGLTQACRREYGELCQEIDNIVNLSIQAQQAAEDKYIESDPL